MINFFITILSLALSQPTPPFEPRTPNIEEKISSPDQPSNPTKSFSRKYPAYVIFANGTKIRGAIFLNVEKISASCQCGNAIHKFEEEMGRIKYIEFHNWQSQRSPHYFYPTTTIIALKDGSQFSCARLSIFDRFKFARNGKTIWCYTFFYQNTSSKKGGKNTQPKDSRINATSLAPPLHPATVQKVEFLIEKGDSLFDIMPLFFK
ncbi:MAG: hypothetical protein N2316_01220 [Spirochaetes bacterium]|nr:hypothetical protein [Spirochaetota bacterium]